MPLASHSRRRSQTVLTAATLAGLGILPSIARAADIHWSALDGNWDTPANWTGGVVPAATDRAVLDFPGGATAHVTTDTADVQAVSVSNANAISVETGGNLTTVENVPDNDPTHGITIGDGGDGSATVTGDGQLKTTGGGFQGTIAIGRNAGANTGTGTLTVNGDTALVEGNDIHIGGSDVPTIGGVAGNGTVNLQNGTIRSRAWSFVGRNGGTGTLNVTGGTYTSNGQFSVGFAGGSGVVNQSAGIVDAPTTNDQGRIFIGRGGTGVYNLSGGTLSSANDFTIGDGGGSSGTLIQTGGTMHNSGGWAFVGRTGGQGLYNISAGEAIVDGNMNIGFEPGGVGTMNQTGGIVRFNELPHIGRAGGNGTYNLSAGQMFVGDRAAGSADDDLVVGADFGSEGKLNMTGGTLTVARWIFAGRAGNSGGGTGTINQSAGTVTSQGWMRLGEAPGAIGTYNLSGTGVASIGGGDADTGDDDIVLGVDFGAQGILNVSDTSQLNAARDIVAGFNGASGTMTQTGGDVNVNGAILLGRNGTSGGATGSGTLTTTGGTLDVNVDMIAGFGLDAGGTATTVDGEINIGGTANVNVTGNTIVGDAVFAGSTATGRMNQSGGSLTTGGLIVAANPGATGTYNLSGGTVTAGTTTNNGTIAASGTAVGNLGPVGGTGAITVADTAQLNAQHVRQASVNMTGGKITIAPTNTGTPAGVSVIPTYTLSGSSRFDLTDNKLITDKSAGTSTGGTYSGVQGDVQRANNFGAWDQPGLTTSKPDAIAGLTTIGVATGEAIRGLGSTDTDVFAGQTITGASTIAMYTYAGDANLDGTIDGGDYGIIDNFAQVPGADSYFNGDFNYDGVIDGGDYGIIDNNNQAQGAPFDTSGGAGGATLSGVTAVPEPATLSVLGLGALGFLSRRRRAK